MAGVLYIVATPIGNLDDISLRAIATLRVVDLIAAEDTRHSRQLLNHLGIDRPMISYHEHNEQSRGEALIKKLEAGSDIALVSDAGTPLISDPGYRLVSAAYRADIRVVPIPGASSLIAALSAAGLPTDRFYFCGFVAVKQQARAAQLATLAELETTLVLFESGRRIEDLLAQIAQWFPDQPCVIGKELTKLHERFLHGRATDLLAQMKADDRLIKGEFVVLIDNARQLDKSKLNRDEISMLEILLDEVSVKMAVKIATRLTGKKKNEIYQLALQLRAGNVSNSVD